ncbi:permease [Meinhardsimonia xiamenensis]|jgi:hypothetical protein|nr:permease [Meinhardsimonia xiamenensis]
MRAEHNGMALITPFGKDGVAERMVSVAMEQFVAVTELMAELVRQIEAGEVPAPGDAKRTVAEYRATIRMAMEERQRLEDKLKTANGVVGGHALDFDAARDEIRRRLARLRAAGGGGEVSG